MTFGCGEALLSEWMEKNAFVSWLEHSSPWTLEAGVIRELRPPLNLAENASHPYYIRLSAVRLDARNRARALAAMVD